MTTAALYVRISADRTGESLGVQRQEAECRELAGRLGLSVTEVYSDNDLSATSGKRRPEFERLLSDAPPVLIVWHTDRLVRTSRDLERVLDLGLTVHAVTAGHIDLSTPAGRAVARTVTAWATYEGEQRTARQLAETRQRALSGRPQWNRRPFGYNPDGTPCEPEAQAVRDAYRDVLDGRSMHDIAREWQDRFPGRKWYPTTVGQILKSARNAGLRTHNGVVVAQGTWTPLVDEATWRAFVDTSKARAHSGTRARKYLLSGIATCGRCGAVMNASSTAGRKVYQCSASPGHLQRNVAIADPIVIESTLRLLSLPGAGVTLTERDHPDADALRSERATLVHRRDVEMPEALAAGLSVAQVAAATRTINARLDEIDAALVDDQRADLFGYATAASTWPEAREALVSEVWDPLPLHTRQGSIAALWAEVVVMPGRGGGVRMTPTAVAEDIIRTAHAEAWYQLD